MQKMFFFSYSNERPVRRRGLNNTKNELQDIIDTFIKYQEENISHPKFVADSYDAMPPTSGFDLIANTFASLIDELNNLKEEISILKDSRIKNDIMSDDISCMKFDIHETKIIG